MALPLPLQLIAMVAHASNERLARRLEYLLEENRLLREVFTETTGRKRLPLTDEPRRRLAIRGKALTPEERESSCQIVRPSASCFASSSPHHNAERLHQRLGGQLVRPSVAVHSDSSAAAVIRCRSRFDGWLDFYHREAARRTATSCGTLAPCAGGPSEPPSAPTTAWLECAS